MAKQKVRIKLQAFDPRVLDQSVEEIVGALEKAGAVIAGPIPLPTRTQRFTVMRSTFIDKDSQEHFELRTHKRLIDIVEMTSKTVDALANLVLPAGVRIDIKFVGQEGS